MSVVLSRIIGRELAFNLGALRTTLEGRVLFCLWSCLGLWYWRRASLQPWRTADNTGFSQLNSVLRSWQTGCTATTNCLRAACKILIYIGARVTSRTELILSICVVSCIM